MIMAIAVIVILGTIMALMLQMTAQTSKQTLNDYMHEQAILLTRSAKEYALLRISGHDRSVNCLTQLNGTYSPDSSSLFDINISIMYIGLSGGNGANECTAAENYIQNADVGDPNSRGSILLDVVVTASSDLNLTEPVRYHRRTLQKL